MQSHNKTAKNRVDKVEDIPYIDPERRISTLIKQVSGTIPLPTQEEIDSDPRLKAILDL